MNKLKIFSILIGLMFLLVCVGCGEKESKEFNSDLVFEEFDKLYANGVEKIEIKDGWIIGWFNDSTMCAFSKPVCIGDLEPGESKKIRINLPIGDGQSN